SSIYGLGVGRVNFAKFLIEKLRKGEKVKALTDQYTSPTHAQPLGEAILEILEKRLTGVFHVVGERMSRYEFALKLAEVLNFNKDLIEAVEMKDMNWIAKRPRDSSLNAEKTRKLLKTNFYFSDVALHILKNECEEWRH
ncbi:MAG: sugar nucleotide-binding protein, partial [Candidatus Bathyarchaeota archaeon]|nr:sugar nucleotide-binding protein [Candidatus Bathyarchaeota archaeon]